MPGPGQRSSMLQPMERRTVTITDSGRWDLLQPLTTSKQINSLSSRITESTWNDIRQFIEPRFLRTVRGAVFMALSVGGTTAGVIPAAIVDGIKNGACRCAKRSIGC